MTTRIQSDRILTPDGFVSGYLYIEGEKITDISTAARPADAEYDFTGRIVSPGFIELHAHGGNGADFLSGDPQDVVTGCAFHLSHGVTSICPTISAAPFRTMERALIAVESAMNSGATRINILGAHLEGPYLSIAQCGAQSPVDITEPRPNDYETLLREHGKAIARWSYAPERDDGSFARALSEHGILASAGHTDALYADMKRGMDNGLKLVTHLYSCVSTVTRDHGFRRLGVIETAWLEDDLYVEIIADGCHLPIDLIRMILKIKGPDRTILITDCLSLTGTPQLEGASNGIEYIVEDGVCKLRDRHAFAGSIATAEVLIRNAMRAGATLSDAIHMMTKTPAALLGINKGCLTPGCDADITVLDDDINVQAVFVSGQPA